VFVGHRADDPRRGDGRTADVYGRGTGDGWVSHVAALGTEETDRMKGLVSTAASRAWLAVVAGGVIVVALVIGLSLIPRLTGGQDVIDAASPAMSDAAVEGEVAATRLLARDVDLVDPLVTRRGGAARQADELVALVSSRARVSRHRARAVLRREAPHTEALLRALPLSGIVGERPALTRFLSATLNIGDEELQGELARSFPRLFATLSELPNVTSGWYDVPGIEGMTRFDARTPVRSVHDVRDYLQDDLVATAAGERDHFAYLAGWGGIGYLPYLLLIVGIVAIAFGLLQVRRAAGHPPGRLAWGVVVAVGVVVMVLVAALQDVERLDGADAMISRLAPAFDAQRVAGLRAGTDLVVQAVAVGDPIMTRAGGAAAEYPQLVTFVAERSGLSQRRVRSRLQRAAPRTTALLEAMPLSAAGREVPHLLAVLSRRLGMSRRRFVETLRRRTPELARSILELGPVTAAWSRIPGTERLERFDGVTPVRSVPDFAGYLDRDVVPVLEDQQQRFDKLASTWPRVDVLPWAMLAIGAIVAIYGAAMMFLATRPPPRR
jgi:hypothetical protein